MGVGAWLDVASCVAVTACVGVLLSDVEPDGDGEADNTSVCVGDADAAGCCEELGAIIVVPSTLWVGGE